MFKFLNFIFIILLAFSLISCKKKTEEDDFSRFFDPSIPGGDNGDYLVRPLYNFKACPNVLDKTCPSETASITGQTTLTWDIPAIYSTENYVVVLFKVDAEGFMSDISIVDPPNQAGYLSLELTRTKTNMFVDKDISENGLYHYWGFIVLNGYIKPENGTNQMKAGYWGMGTKITVQTTMNSSNSVELAPNQFWEKTKWSSMVSQPLGYYPNITYTQRTFEPGSASITNPSGRILSVSGGSVSFVVDSSKNRILIFDNAALRMCEQYKNDPVQYYACQLQAQSDQQAPHNILGQPDEKTVLSCQEHDSYCKNLPQSSCESFDYSKNRKSFCKYDPSTSSCSVKGDSCFTNPTGIYYNNGKLFVVDSGNHRVMMYESIFFKPNNVNEDYLIGCDPSLPNMSSKTNPTKCAATKLFGKKNWNDFNLYPISVYGESSLNNPADVVVDGDDLLIADLGNNRIVKVLKYFGTDLKVDFNDYYSCSDLTWMSNKCRWSGILGQESYFENKTLKDFYNSNHNLLTGTFSQQIVDASLLKRYFARPNKLLLKKNADGTNSLFVSSNENFLEESVSTGSTVSLMGRILIFNKNPLAGVIPLCNKDSFLTGECNANKVIGQDGFDKLLIVSGSGGGNSNYSSSVYGLEFINDMTFIDNSLAAIDPKNNNVYIWKDVFNNNVTGIPYDFKVVDPEGRYIGNSQSLPDLFGISGISYSDTSKQIMVSDGIGGKVYQIDLIKVPTE